MKFLVLLLTLVSCSEAPASSKAYALMAAESRGIEPDNLVIVPGARSELPTILHRCQVKPFREFKISDGLVGFRFQLRQKEQSKSLSCIQKAMPRGAWVEETIVP